MLPSFSSFNCHESKESEREEKHRHDINGKGKQYKAIYPQTEAITGH